MVSTFYVAPTKNFVSKTLNGAITAGATTITLNNTTNIQAPGYAVIDRTDSSGNATPNSRETVFFTGVNSTQLTGVTRATDGEGGTGLAHGDGALVEFTFTEGMWNSLVTIVAQGLDGNGYMMAMASPMSLAIAQITQAAIVSVASITEERVTRSIIAAATITGSLTVTTGLNVSGASLTGFGFHPTWVTLGSYSGATTSILQPLVMPQAGTFQFVHLVTRFVASGASAVIDINKNGTSIFGGAAGTRPAILAGGTFVSSASIANKTFNAGDVLTLDYAGTTGQITGFTVMLRAA